MTGDLVIKALGQTHGKLELSAKAKGCLCVLDKLAIAVDFIKTQQSYGPDCAPEGIFTRDKEYAKQLGVTYAPCCGVFLKDGTDIPCLACAGPDPLGHWNGVTEDGRVMQWLAEEVA